MPDSRTLQTAFAVLALVALHLPVAAQQISPSSPTTIPAAPPLIPIGDIPDLDQAPPIAVDAIITLINLGAYPLGPDFSVQPNKVLTEIELAFMLINLFRPGITGEFPVDSVEALVQLRVLSGDELSEDGRAIVTGTTFLSLLYAVLELSPELEEALLARLTEALPAWTIGNFDIPLTRAAAAILLVAAVEFLAERQLITL